MMGVNANISESLTGTIEAPFPEFEAPPANPMGMAVSIPGFDPARGVVFLISSGYPFGNVPSYRISGNVITFLRGGSPNVTYVLHAVMFS